MTQFMALNLTITAENADEVIAKLKTLGATASGEAAAGVETLDVGLTGLSETLGKVSAILFSIETVRKMWEWADEGELATNRLGIAFRNLGLNVEHFTTLIAKAEAPILAFGQFTESQLNLALATMVQITQNVSGSLEHMNIVAGLAASGQYDLHGAATLVGRAMEGQWIMLNRMDPALKTATDKWAELTRFANGFLEAKSGTLSGQLARVGTELATITEHMIEMAGGSSTLSGAVDPLIKALEKLDALLPQIAHGFSLMFKPLELAIDIVKHPLESIKQMLSAVGGLLVGIGGGGWESFFGPPTVPGMFVNAPSISQATVAPGAPNLRELVSGGPSSAQIRGDRFFPAGGGITNTSPVDALFGAQTTTIGGLGAQADKSGDLAGLNNTLAQVMARYKEQLEQAKEASQQITAAIGGMWQHMFEGMSNALEHAFQGKKIGSVFKELGQSILQGFGQMFQEQGVALLQYGVIMLGLMPLLSNPFTSGPAAIAAGIALVALGAAFNAIASSGAAPGSGAGGSSASGMVSPHGVSSTSYLLPSPGSPFASGEKYPGLVQPVFNVIGSGDPRAMRDMAQLLNNMVGRGYSAPGISGT